MNRQDARHAKSPENPSCRIMDFVLPGVLGVLAVREG